MVYWEPRIENMSPEDLEALQYRLLKTLVYRLYSFSDFYHRKMKEANVHPDDIRSLEDVRKLPFMTKKDLRDGYPDKIFAVPKKEVVRYHVSSGTTGKPTMVGYTRNDIDDLVDLAGPVPDLHRAGVRRRDPGQQYLRPVHGGLGFHYAAEKIGAAVVPASTGNTERQIELIQDLGVTAMAATPSYMLHLGEVAEKMGMSIKNDTKLRVGLLGGEPWSAKMRDRIEEWLGVKGFNCYGTSELSGPLFTECSEQNGIHVWGDLTYIEVLDPETGEPVAPGEKGEMVITMLQKEALPDRPVPHRGHHLHRCPRPARAAVPIRASPASSAGWTTC